MPNSKKAKIPLLWFPFAIIFLLANALPVISAEYGSSEKQRMLATRLEAMPAEIQEKVKKRIAEIENELHADLKGITRDTIDVRKKRGKIQTEIASLTTEIKTANPEEKKRLQAKKDALIEEFNQAVSDDSSYRLEYTNLRSDYEFIVEQAVEEILSEAEAEEKKIS